MNNKKWLPVSDVDLSGNERDYLLNAFDLGWLSGSGPFVGRFEQGFFDSEVHCQNLNGQRIRKPPFSYRHPRLPCPTHFLDVVSGSQTALEIIRGHLREHDKNKHWASENESLIASILTVLGKLIRRSE